MNSNRHWTGAGSETITITGGAGFIGGHFRRRLSDLGMSTTTLDIRAPVEARDGERVVVGDVRDPGALYDALKGATHVLHLAAAHHDFGISRDTFFSVNVEGAETICQVMDDLGVRSLCFFSTVAVYGPEGIGADEDTDCRPDGPYGESKLEAERVFTRWAGQGDDRSLLIIRPTVTFGPGHFANMYTLIQQIESRLFLPVGSGENRKSLVYVENIVDATLELWLGGAESGVRVFNAVDKPDLTSGEIESTIYTSLGRKPPRMRIGLSLALGVAWVFDIVIARTGWNFPISTARIRKFAEAETVYSSERLRQSGFSPRVELKTGIERMVQWYRHTGRALPLDRSIPPAEVRHAPDGVAASRNQGVADPRIAGDPVSAPSNQGR